MSGYPYERRPRPEPKRRRRTVLWIVLAIATLALVFALGVALGEALHQDSPSNGLPQTFVRTLTSLPKG
ncbi:MAG: hypothetical protein ABI927_01690 [Gaiellaceae bacterium]